MAQMYTIVLQCPLTSKLVLTGIKTSSREALNNGIFRSGKAYCPHCGQIHFFEGNAFLEVDKKSTATELWRPNP
jgi:hypothetical protein